jgi:hypothetical protein
MTSYIQTHTNSVSSRRSAVERRRAHTISRTFSTGPIAATFIVILAIFVLGVWYLFVEGQLATAGYDIRELEARVDVLAEENRKLELEAAQARSIQTIEASSQKLNMVKSDQVVFVKRTTPFVAALSQ